MENSVILSLILKLYKRLCLYYSYSGIYKLIKGLSDTAGQLCQGSSIGHFFMKRWKTDVAWKNSFTIVVLLTPIRLARSVSVKLTAFLKSYTESSTAVSGTVKFLDNIFNTSTRLYGLFLLAFTVTEGVLWISLKAFAVKYLLLRIALLILAALLILTNKPVKALFNGSFIGKLIVDFFVVRGIENATDNK